MMQWSDPVHSNTTLCPSGGTCTLPTIASASDFNTVLSSDQNTLDGTQSQHSQHSTSQDDMADIEEGTQCPAAVQLADAQVSVVTSGPLESLRSSGEPQVLWRASGPLESLRSSVLQTADSSSGARVHGGCELVLALLTYLNRT